MSLALRTVIVDSDATSRAALRRILAATPSVTVVNEFSELSAAAVEARSSRPDLLIVEVSSEEDAAVAAVHDMAKTFPEAAIFAIGTGVSADLVIRVIRAGAVEFIRRPVDRADVVAALDKIARFRRGSETARRTARITSVFCPKGGLGVTTMAVNLAVCVAGERQNTLLMDLDSRHSDSSTFLNLRPTYSVLDAFENLDRLDESFLRGLLVKHGSGLWALPGPSRMEGLQITGEQVQAGLEIIRSHFDHVILDLRHDFDPATIAALEASDVILYLTALNVAALRSGAAGLAAFRHLGINLQRVRVIVMREDSSEDVTLKHARDTLGVPIYWKTPSDYQTLVSAINSGQPVVTLAPRSRIARNLRQLADMLVAPGPTATPAKRTASLLGLVWTPKGSPGA
jgi:pilus assembly protein CpaE